MSGPRRLWGGRFDGPADPELDRFTSSFSFDRVLAPWDLVASLAHARMLFERGVVGAADGEAILLGLSGMLRDVESGSLVVDGDDEDVHTWIERLLTERIGDPGRRLHTARSRNDQTGAALRLLVRARLIELLRAVDLLGDTLVELAGSHLETFLPGYTHLQRGQPVSLAHHLLAHFWFLDADANRLRRAHEVAAICPLGAGALAGSVHPIDPARTAELLGLVPFRNSMHAVADRDYVVECSFACALLLVHLSRWAEEVVLWTTREFGFARLSDSVAKGSSLMPQKKNPEAAEVLRGKSGRVVGDLVAHLVQLKGLPLTYNSDLQEDKEALFDALDAAAGGVGAADALLRGLRFDTERMRAALRGGFLTATDLADGLVLRGVAFRDAHESAGRAVRRAEDLGVELWELPLEELQACCPRADGDLLRALDPEASVRAHASPGGPAPQRVAEQLAAARAALSERAAWRDEQAPPPIYRAHLEGALLHPR
ncbi:MAG TPA: argininosuccinate lyase [Thermoanaerobaculia bacterium]|nr:argininosuccinate lyase [Thermoanaerobaculia bacterium]